VLPEACKPVVPKKLLQILVFALPLSVVSLAVILGGSVIARGMGDDFGARVLAWIAGAILMLIVADMFLLMTVLGLKALADQRDESTGGPR
jgi:hypothetical protein